MELRSQRKKVFPLPRDDEPVRKKRKITDESEPSLDLDNDSSTVVAANNTSQLDSLPIELLHIIFSYLSTCDKVSLRMVCKRLRFVLDDPDHWRRVIIPPYISAKNPKYVQSVLKHGKSHIQSLSLVGYSSTTSSYLTSCTSVTALDLYGSRITNSAIKQLLLRLPNLSRLSISDGVAQALLPILPALQQLVITMRRPLSFKNFKRISSNFDRLRSQLAMDSPPKPSNIAIKHADYPSIGYFQYWRFISYGFGNLSEYELSTTNTLQAVSIPSFISNNSTKLGSFHIPGIPDAISKPPIIVSTAVSSGVLSANINYTHAFVADTSSCVSTICPSFGDIATNITSLDLKGITLQSLDNVRNIVEFTPNLLVISVNDVRLSSYDDPLDVLFKALSVYCPKLTSIFAALVGKRYSNEQCYVENACEVWNNILSLKHLEHLSVCSCLFLESPAPNDHHLYPNLKLLPISFQSLILNIHRMEAANLDTVVTNICSIQHLQMLHLHIDSFKSHTTKPVILNLQLLLENCTKLEELLIKPTMSSHIQICSSPAIIQLKYLKLMNSISVPKLFFTDLVPIGQRNMNLQVLNCEDSCIMDGTEAIRFLEHCPSLVSFTCNPSHRGIEFEEPVKDIAKKHDLLNFHYGFFTRNHRSISSNIELSILKLM